MVEVLRWLQDQAPVSQVWIGFQALLLELRDLIHEHVLQHRTNHILIGYMM